MNNFQEISSFILDGGGEGYSKTKNILGINYDRVYQIQIAANAYCRVKLPLFENEYENRRTDVSGGWTKVTDDDRPYYREPTYNINGTAE